MSTGESFDAEKQCRVVKRAVALGAQRPLQNGGRRAKGNRNAGFAGGLDVDEAGDARCARQVMLMHISTIETALIAKLTE